MRELLIVGVDPGTTVGYAVLDTNRNVLRIKSSKQLELNSIVEEISGIGSVLVIGTDKKKCPGLIEKAAAKTGARVIQPREDLMVAEKDTMTLGFATGNEHEKDALAAAFFAYKDLEPLFGRIRKALENENKPHLFMEVAKTVVMAGINIKDALRRIGAEADAGAKESIRMAEPTVAATKEEAALKEPLQNMPLRRVEKENEILRNYNTKLLMKIRVANKELRSIMKARAQAMKPVSKAELEEREKRHNELIKKMQLLIEEKERQIARLKSEQDSLCGILAKGDITVKKLDTLGLDELQRKSETLGIRENDVILVEKPESFSEKVLEFVLQKNITLITREKAKGNVERMLKDMGITVIQAEGLKITEAGSFATVSMDELNEAKRKSSHKSILGIIENYKDERKAWKS